MEEAQNANQENVPEKESHDKSKQGFDIKAFKNNKDNKNTFFTGGGNPIPKSYGNSAHGKSSQKNHRIKHG